MLDEKGFSLVEVLIVLLLTSVVLGVIYQFLTVGVNFLETYTKKSEFDIKNLLFDIEYEKERSLGLDLKDSKLVFFNPEYQARYIFSPPSSDLKIVVMKELIKKNGVKLRKNFVIRNILKIELTPLESKHSQKLLIRFINPKGKLEREVML